MNPFIHINGNRIDLADALRQDIQNNFFSAFEKSVFNCIKSWNSQQTSFTLFTSGSTGEPKPITFTRTQLKTSARNTINALLIKPFQTSLICLDARYIAGQMMIVRSLENNMNIIAIEPCADPLKEISINEKIDFAAFVPYQLRTVLESRDSTKKLNQIRTIIIGGAAVDENTMHQLQALQCQSYATYGMTETITHIALQKLNGIGKQDYFEALNGISLSVDDRQCLIIEADYLKEKVITNDIVQLLSTNKFRWLGRFDNVINSGGLKIIPENIEAKSKKVFYELNITSRYFVAGIPDLKLGERIILVVEGNDHSTKNELLKRLTSFLPKYEVPKEIYFISHFIETNTQKIDRIGILKSLGLT